MCSFNAALPWPGQVLSQSFSDLEKSTSTPVDGEDRPRFTLHSVEATARQDSGGVDLGTTNHPSWQGLTSPGIRQPVVQGSAVSPSAAPGTSTHSATIPHRPVPVRRETSTLPTALGHTGHIHHHRHTGRDSGYQPRRAGGRTSAFSEPTLTAPTRHASTPPLTKAQATRMAGPSSTRPARTTHVPNRVSKPPCTSCASTHRLVRRIASHVNRVSDLLKQCKPSMRSSNTNDRVPPARKGDTGQSMTPVCYRCPAIVQRAVGQAELLRCRAEQLGERMSGGHWYLPPATPSTPGATNKQRKGA